MMESRQSVICCERIPAQSVIAESLCRAAGKMVFLWGVQTIPIVGLLKPSDVMANRDTHELGYVLRGLWFFFDVGWFA